MSQPSIPESTNHGQTQRTRTELRNLMDQFVLTSRSQEIRIELSDLIVACYVAGDLSRVEYHSAMEEVR